MPTMLRQRVYGDERLFATSPVPVRHQLVLVQLRPPTGHSQGSRRQVPAEQRAVDRHRGRLVAVLGVEMGDR
jgi:hypothetical protein